MRWIFFLLLISSCRVWTDRSLPSPVDLHDITFYKNEGWIVSYGTGVILKSNNFGRSWNVISNLDSLYFEKIQFLNDKLGWIAGERGTLLKTTDGGRHWQKMEVDPDDSNNLLFYSMLWTNKNTGFLCGQIRNENEVHNFIYHTEDGGFNWTKHKVPTLFFNLTNTTHGIWWASATDRIYSSNNGIDWREVYFDSLKTSGQLRGLVVTDDNIFLATGFKGSLLRSKDGGSTWEVEKVSPNRLRQVQLVDAESILLAGDKTANDNNVLLTRDNGLTWILIEVKSDVHRLVTHGARVWLIGKKGLIMSYRQRKVKMCSLGNSK